MTTRNGPPASKTHQEACEGVEIWFERESGKFFIETQREERDRWRGPIIRRFSSLSGARQACKVRALPAAAVAAFSERRGWQTDFKYQKVEIAGVRKRGYRIHYLDREGTELDSAPYYHWDEALIKEIEECDDSIRYYSEKRQKLLRERGRPVLDTDLDAAQQTAKGA